MTMMMMMIKMLMRTILELTDLWLSSALSLQPLLQYTTLQALQGTGLRTARPRHWSQYSVARSGLILAARGSSSRMLVPGRRSLVATPYLPRPSLHRISTQDEKAGTVSFTSRLFPPSLGWLTSSLFFSTKIDLRNVLNIIVQS